MRSSLALAVALTLLVLEGIIVASSAIVRDREWPSWSIRMCSLDGGLLQSIELTIRAPLACDPTGLRAQCSDPHVEAGSRNIWRLAP
jgi:hypothetical protein